MFENSSQSDDRTKLTVQFGLPGVSAEVSLPLRVLSRAWHLIRRTPLAEQVHVGAELAEVNVRGPDQGDVAVALAVSNFASRELEVEGVHVDWARVGSGSLDMPQAHFLAHGMRLPPRSVCTIWFRIGLAAPDIRSFKMWIPEAPTPRSSPSGRVEMHGHLRLCARRREWRKEFGVSIRGVAWNVWLPEEDDDKP